LLLLSIYTSFPGYKSYVINITENLFQHSFTTKDTFYLSNDKSNNGFTYSYFDNYAFEHEKTNNNNNENPSSPNEFNETVGTDYRLFTKTIIENNEIFGIKKFYVCYTGSLFYL
jgi:hypothetical protein